MNHLDATGFATASADRLRADVPRDSVGAEQNIQHHFVRQAASRERAFTLTRSWVLSAEDQRTVVKHDQRFVQYGIKGSLHLNYEPKQQLVFRMDFGLWAKLDGKEEVQKFEYEITGCVQTLNDKGDATVERIATTRVHSLEAESFQRGRDIKVAVTISATFLSVPAAISARRPTLEMAASKTVGELLSETAPHEGDLLVIAANGDSLRVHSVVLKAQSAVFERMLAQTSMREARTASVCTKISTGVCLRFIVDTVYDRAWEELSTSQIQPYVSDVINKGNVKVSVFVLTLFMIITQTAHVQELLEFADYYQLGTLEYRTIKFITDTIAPSNALSYYVATAQWSPEVHDLCAAHVAEYFTSHNYEELPLWSVIKKSSELLHGLIARNRITSNAPTAGVEALAKKKRRISGYVD
jgi:hypothetical protein